MTALRKSDGEPDGACTTGGAGGGDPSGGLGLSIEGKGGGSRASHVDIGWCKRNLFGRVRCIATLAGITLFQLGHPSLIHNFFFPHRRRLAMIFSLPARIISCVASYDDRNWSDKPRCVAFFAHTSTPRTRRSRRWPTAPGMRPNPHDGSCIGPSLHS